MATVTEVLTAATDSVTLINAIDDDSHNVEGMSQEEINEIPSSLEKYKLEE